MKNDDFIEWLLLGAVLIAIYGWWVNKENGVMFDYYLSQKTYADSKEAVG